MTSAPQIVHVDIAIIGGGVAGLWLLNRVRNAGYNAVLFEQQALGSGQTVASQGMIHGGVKYTLGGALSGASEAIAGMPDHWRRCIHGEGDVDLRGTQVLSEHFYMWSTQNMFSKATAFLASKALRGRVDTVKPADYPEVFQNKAFRGSLYRLLDMVIDTPSLMKVLQAQQEHYVFSAGSQALQLRKQEDGVEIFLQNDQENLCVRSQLLVLAAGKGNGELLQQLRCSQPAMQLRPLQQVMVRHQDLHTLYAHCVDKDSKPRLTISTHQDGDAVVWYLGGQLAEEGVGLSAPQLINNAKKEMQVLFPWIDWQQAQWAVFPVDRAEPKQPGLLRPDNAWLSACEDLPQCVVAWPTKLTLVPNLAQLLMEYLQEKNIYPREKDNVPLEWPRMTAIEKTPWQAAQWMKI